MVIVQINYRRPDMWNGPIVTRMRANPDVGELEIRVFDVRQPMSEITRAPLGVAVPSQALAAE